MTPLLLLPPALSLAVLAAHFYRAASWPLLLACCVLIGLLAWPRAWVARAVSLALIAGAAEWLWTAWLLVQQRQALGQPWFRLAVILGVVALLTAASVRVFASTSLRRHFGLPDRQRPQ